MRARALDPEGRRCRDGGLDGLADSCARPHELFAEEDAASRRQDRDAGEGERAVEEGTFQVRFRFFPSVSVYMNYLCHTTLSHNTTWILLLSCNICLRQYTNSEKYNTRCMNRQPCGCATDLPIDMSMCASLQPFEMCDAYVLPTYDDATKCNAMCVHVWPSAYDNQIRQSN